MTMNASSSTGRVEASASFSVVALEGTESSSGAASSVRYSLACAGSSLKKPSTEHGGSLFTLHHCAYNGTTRIVSYSSVAVVSPDCRDMTIFAVGGDSNALQRCQQRAR